MSNVLVTNQLAGMHETQKIRVDMMNLLTDADLAYKLPGDNVTLGALCREMGETEQIYIDSFKSFKMNWAIYRTSDPALAGSVDQLKAWYQTLDQQFDAAIEALSDDDIRTKKVNRQTFAPDLTVQFHIYREAQLIFYAKATCYLRALEKPLPSQMASWIG
ncbi:MAG TPA: DinB family protein [Phototrophicaceae bacterium]|nr:DinB family protein [Phototrophicaceae bacterium]